MMALLTRLLAAPLTDAFVSVLKTAGQRKLSEEEARAKAQKAIAAALGEASASLDAARRDALLADLRGEGWLQRNWRPIVALTAFFTYWHVVAVIPHLVSWGWMAPPRFGERGLDNLFLLTSICVGGYIGGRTVEKIASLFRFR